MNNLYSDIERVISRPFLRKITESFLTSSHFAWGVRKQGSELFPTRIRGLSIFFNAMRDFNGAHSMEVWCWYHTQFKVRKPILCMTIDIPAEAIIADGRMAAHVSAVLERRQELIDILFCTITADTDYMAAWKQVILDDKKLTNP